MINVTKTFLPPLEEYNRLLERVWKNGWVTNNGELVRELQERLKNYLGVKHLLFCTNGTIALQIALKALGIKGEVVTTPYSYVATTGAILWENCTPVFVDIDKNNFCIDPLKIEAAITEKTSAILATHVYGQACDIDTIRKIADKYSLKLIYDGAHAFGTKYKGQSIFNYGDISTCSFHATKIFHTAEGGCIVTNDDELAQQVKLHHHFGHINDDHFCIGINGKNSELHAAMGLCNLNYIGDILQQRKKQWKYYLELLQDKGLQLLNINNEDEFNFSYFPVIFENENSMLDAIALLNENQIFPRRYFYPSLNRLPYLKYSPLPVSESISQRVLCLPLYHELSNDEQEKIAQIILHAVKQFV